MDINHFSLKVEPMRDNNPRRVRILLYGEITVQNAAQFKKQMLLALEEKDICFIDIEGIKQIDLSGIQLIYSVYLYAINRKFDLKVSGRSSLAFLNTVKEAGFEKVEWLSFES